MRRSLSLIASLVLAFAFAPTGTTEAAGPCAGQSNDHLIVYKLKENVDPPYTNVDFDGVRGDAYVANLDPCIGPVEAGGAHILLATLESRRNEGHIIQLGYGQQCSACTPDFYWTPNNDGSAQHWPGALTPVKGHRVRGIIVRSWSESLGQYRARFTLTDLDTNQTEIYYSNNWSGDYETAWWGAETIDNGSELGAIAGSTYWKVQMAYMGYSPEGSTVWTYRSGLTSGDVYRDGTTGSNEHLHIGTWVYGNDMIQLENH